MEAPPYDEANVIQLAERKDLYLDSGHSHACTLSWDWDGAVVDLDVQAIIVDRNGCIFDVAYYNNLKACGRAVTHSGDEKDGKTNGIDEKITIFFNKLPEGVALILISVFCYRGGNFKAVASGLLRVLDEETRQVIGRFPLSHMGADATGLVACALHCSCPMNWVVQPMSCTLPGQHFMDALPLLNGVIRQFLPNAPNQQKVHFEMAKGDAMDMGMAQTTLVCGLGWDTGSRSVDLDCSAVLMDYNANPLETVFFGNLKSSGEHSQHGAVVHSGDNLTGHGEGDDEQVHIDFSRLGPSLQQIFFVINIFSNGMTFKDVKNPYCRVWDGVQELCRYRLVEAPNARALIISRLRRDAISGRWSFTALGVPSTGMLCKHCIPDIQKLYNTPSEELRGPVAPPPPPIPYQNIQPASSSQQPPASRNKAQNKAKKENKFSCTVS